MRHQSFRLPSGCDNASKRLSIVPQEVEHGYHQDNHSDYQQDRCARSVATGLQSSKKLGSQRVTFGGRGVLFEPALRLVGAIYRCVLQDACRRGSLVARSWIKKSAPKPRVLSFAPVCIREVRNSGIRGPDRLWVFGGSSVCGTSIEPVWQRGPDTMAGVKGADRL